MRLTPWAMAYSSSRLVPSTFTSCRTSGSPRKWRTKAWWTTASGRSVRNTSSNLRLRMSTTYMRTSAGCPSHGARSTPMIRHRAPAMRRAMSRPWPPAIPVISTVSTGSATARGGSDAGATRADAAISPAGDRLFAVNTPDNRLAIYTITAGGLTLAAEVPVGLEPVAVAARTNLAGRTEAWVVNHLSDSVSIVEVDPTDVTRSRVVRTLLVGDEPRDLVFAGSAHSRAFITCAHRGQNRPGDPQLTTAG